MYNSNADSLGLILDVEVFFLWVTVQEHCEPNWTRNMAFNRGHPHRWVRHARPGRVNLPILDFLKGAAEKSRFPVTH